MPIRRVPGGYQWGQTGKVYPTKAQAEAQARAIYASGYREKPRKQKRNREYTIFPYLCVVFTVIVSPTTVFDRPGRIIRAGVYCLSAASIRCLNK